MEKEENQVTKKAINKKPVAKKVTKPIDTKVVEKNEEQSTCCEENCSCNKENCVQSVLKCKVGNIPVIAIIGSIILLALLIMIGMKLFGNKTDILEYPVVFVNDDDEVFVATKKAKANQVDKDSDSADVMYKNNKTDKFLYLSEDLYEVKAKNGEKEKIASDVREAMYSDDDKYIVYINEDGDLYSYKKDAEKIAKDVSGIYDIINGKIYYSKDGNLYVIKVSGKKDAEKIASDVSSFNVDEDEKNAIYLKSDDGSYELYTYKLSNGKSKKMTSDIDTIVASSEDFKEFIFTKEADGSSFDLKNILKDDLKDEDERYMDLYNGSGYNSMSYTEKYKKYEVEERNEIRDYVKDEKFGIDCYDVFYVKNGKVTKLAEGVSEVLDADPETKQIVYTKETLNTSKKLKISDYSYSYKFESDVKALLTSDLYYSKNGKKEIEIESKVKDANAYLLNGNQLYYILEEDGDSTLYYAKIGSKKIEGKEIDSDLYSQSLTEFNGGFIYGVDYSTKSYEFDLKFVKNGKVKKAASDVYARNSYTLSNDENKLYFYTNYDDGEGTLSSYNGNKVKEVIKDIYKVYYLNDDYMYVLSDCNKSHECELGLYTGSKKIKKIASDVTEVISYR